MRTTLARPPPYASEWEVYTLAPVLRVGSVAWSPMALDQMPCLLGGVALAHANGMSRPWRASDAIMLRIPNVAFPAPPDLQI